MLGAGAELRVSVARGVAARRRAGARALVLRRAARAARAGHALGPTASHMFPTTQQTLPGTSTTIVGLFTPLPS